MMLGTFPRAKILLKMGAHEPLNQITLKTLDDVVPEPAVENCKHYAYEPLP